MAPEKRRRRKRFSALRRNLLYYLALPTIAVLSLLPLRLARALGYALGTLGWLIAARERRIAMENLRAAFPEGDTPGLRRICRGVFRNAVTNVLEVLVVQRWSREKVRRVFPLGEEFEKVYASTSEGEVGMTAHLGNWELLGILFGAFLPGHMVPVAKRIYFEKYQRLVERFRARVGLEVVYTDESPRMLLGVIRRRKYLGLLPDQDLKVVNGIFVDFFGRPAYTSTTPVHLALTTRKNLSVCYLVREGRRFRIIFRDVPLVRTGNRQQDFLENTRRWTRILEEEIRARVDQWVWFHRRWRTRPEDGPRKVLRRRRRDPAAK